MIKLHLLFSARLDICTRVDDGSPCMYRWVNLGESSREESRLAYSNQRSMFYRREHLSLNKYLVYVVQALNFCYFAFLLYQLSSSRNKLLSKGEGVGSHRQGRRKIHDDDDDASQTEPRGCPQAGVVSFWYTYV